MSVGLRGIRLRAAALLILLYLWLARPTAALLWIGAPLILAGLVLRGWAAGTIEKEKELATGGPYAYTRNPLYLGSVLLGAGLAVAGGHWGWPTLFLAFFATVYVPTMASEHRLLGERFGDRYRAYVAAVPALLPRRTAWREPGRDTTGFTWAQYLRNREWEAGLGALAGLAFLALKAWLAAR